MVNTIKIKAICPRCGVAIEYTKSEKIKSIILSAIVGFFLVLGVFSFVIYTTVYINPEVTDGLFSYYVTIMNTKYARSHALELRSVAMNWTEDCMFWDKSCSVYNIYDHMLNETKYVYKSKYKIFYRPDYILETGGADCMGLSTVYVALLHSIGIDATVDCNINYNHCVAVVPNKDTYFRVDVAKKSLQTRNNDVDVWG